MYRHVIIISLLCFPSLVFSQIDSSLLQAFSDNLYAFNLATEGAEGSGASILENSLMDAQYIMVGEQHGILEVCRFIEFLAVKTADLGFSRLAIETSPFAAEELSSIISQGTKGIAELQNRFPFAVPFYNNQDDARLLEVVNQAWKGQAEFWGLDQVFVVEPRLIFSKLEQLAPDSAAKALATDYLQRSIASFSKALETQKFDEVILFALDETAFSQLRDAFERSTKAVAMIDALAETREIYLAWFEGRNYDNNNNRIQLMKRNLSAYHRKAMREGNPEPKIIFRFGSNHMQRGLTSVNVFDLGNMMSELAQFKAQKSVHILFSGLQGEQFNSLLGMQSYDARSDMDPYILQALPSLEGDDWHLIDFRPVRQLRLKNIDPKLKSLIFGFDFWVLVPETKGVTAF